MTTTTALSLSSALMATVNATILKLFNISAICYENPFTERIGLLETGLFYALCKSLPMYFIREAQRGTNWSTQSPTTGRISLTGQIDSPGKHFKLFYATLILNIAPSAIYSTRFIITLLRVRN